MREGDLLKLGLVIQIQRGPIITEVPMCFERSSGKYVLQISNLANWVCRLRGSSLLQSTTGLLLCPSSEVFLAVKIAFFFSSQVWAEREEGF